MGKPPLPAFQNLHHNKLYLHSIFPCTFCNSWLYLAAEPSLGASVQAEAQMRQPGCGKMSTHTI